MWMRSRVFVWFVVFLVALAVLHQLGIAFFLYWTYLWFDIPMHTLGGIVVALGFLTVCERYVRDGGVRALVLTLGAVLAVGVLWEVFELISGLEWRHAGYVADTALDLTMDMVGAALGYALARQTLKREGTGVLAQSV